MQLLEDATAVCRTARAVCRAEDNINAPITVFSFPLLLQYLFFSEDRGVLTVNKLIINCFNVEARKTRCQVAQAAKFSTVARRVLGGGGFIGTLICRPYLSAVVLYK